MNRALNRLGLVLLGSAFVLAGCNSGGGTSQMPTTGLSQKIPFTPTLQDEINASNGFPSLSLRSQLALRATEHNASAPARVGANLIYSGDFTNNVITYFSSIGTNPPPLGQITTGLDNPERLFVDKNLNLYATNLTNSTIVEYPPKGTSPKLTISTGVNSPTGLVVDANGTIYCANVGNDTVTEYPAGQTSPSLTINMGSNLPEYLAVDANDNLYVSYIGSPGNVMKFKPGSTTGTPLNLQVGNAGAVEVDRSGNIILIDLNVPAIDVFPAGKKVPSKKIPVTAGDPFTLSLGAAEKQLYVSVLVNTSWVIQHVAYPTGTMFANKITSNVNGWPIAVSPDNAL